MAQQQGAHDRPGGGDGQSAAPARSAGDTIEADFDGEGRLYPGKVAQVNAKGTCNILHDDGDRESEAPSSRIRSTKGAAKEEASGGPPKAGRSVWQEFADGDGDAYYYNSETKESTWTRPDEFTAAAAAAVPSGESAAFAALRQRPREDGACHSGLERFVRCRHTRQPAHNRAEYREAEDD